MPRADEEPRSTQTATGDENGSPPRVSGTFTKPERVGPYRIVDLLGHGGMGVVHSAVDERFGTRIALKSLERWDDTRLRALKREFRTIADFAHPNVVRMYDLFAQDAAWFVAMELIDGTDFAAFARRATFERFRAAIGELLTGLHALHESGWVHRDIKASNVIVESVSGRIVLLDFGLTEALGEGRRDPRILGTRSHMAPELLRGAPATPASDFYALGVMLSESLAACAALREAAGEAWLECARRLLSSEPELRPTAPELARLLGAPATSLTSPRRRRAPLVGRDHELASLHAALEDAAGGALVMVEVSGTAGIGKSALAKAFLADVEEHGRAKVFQSRCHAHETIPFNAVDGFIDLLVVEFSENPASAAQLDEPKLEHAVEMFPALSPLRKTSSAISDQPRAQRRTEAFAELGTLLAIVRRELPLLLFVDDAHWGDTDSALLLNAALRTSAAGARGAMLLWTTRPDTTRSSFVSHLERAAIDAGERIRRIALAPIDAPASERLVRELAPEVAPDELAAITGEAHGSPFLLAKFAGGRTPFASKASRLGTVIDAELEGGDPSLRVLLRTIALARAPIGFEVASRAAGVQVDVQRAVSDLRARHLVIVQPTGNLAERTVEIYHDELREPLLAEVEPSRLPELHRRLAKALRASPTASPGLTSLHLHAAGDLADAAVYAETAARHADGTLAFASAARHYRNAIAWGGAAAGAELQVCLADALFNSGECVESARAFAVARERAGRADDRVLAVRQATAWFSAGHVDEGVEGIQSLLGELGLSPPRAAWLLPAIGAKLVRLRLRGLELPLEAGAATDAEAAFRSDLCWSMGQGLSMFMSKEGAYFAIQSLFEALPLADPRRVGRGLAFVGGISANLGGKMAEWGQAWLRRAEAISTEHDDDYVNGWCHVWRANAELVKGDFLRAVELAERGIRLMEHGPYAMSWECHTARCFALMARERRGDWLEVERSAKDVLARAAAHDDRYARVVFSLFAANVALAAGDLGRARDLATTPMQAWTKDYFTVQHFYALRIHAYADLLESQTRSAAARVDEAWRRIQASDVAAIPSASQDAEVLKAHVELGLSQTESANRSQHLRRAAGIAKRLSARSKEARAHALLLQASVHRLGGDLDAAARSSHGAAEAFEQLHMDLLGAVARRARFQSLQNHDMVAKEDERLEAFGIRAPERWLHVFAPGFA